MIGLARHYGTAIVGGGPAGLGPLLAASRNGTLASLLDDGLVIIDRRPAIGAGRLGDYVIRSDSAALSFLSCLDGVQDSRLAAVRDMPSARALAACGSGPVELTMVARFLNDVGRAVRAIVETAPRGVVLTSHDVVRARRIMRGAWQLSVRGPRAQTIEIRAARLLLAGGADQDDARLARERLFDKTMLSVRHRLKVVQSDLVLRPEGLRAALARLAGHPSPRIVVLGGSTSAVAAARLLLQALPVTAEPGAVTLLHRGRPRLFYHSAAEARADGYDEFGPDDICPVSGFVHRLGGLRYDARDLMRHALEIGGRVPDTRLALLDGSSLLPGNLDALLDEANLVIAALGYRPRGLPLRDRHGVAVRLAGGERTPMVDHRCRVLNTRGEVLPGVLGIGLAAGVRTTGTLGGEPSFRGQTNSLWLWQHDIGALVAAGLLETEPVARSKASELWNSEALKAGRRSAPVRQVGRVAPNGVLGQSPKLSTNSV